MGRSWWRSCWYPVLALGGIVMMTVDTTAATIAPAGTTRMAMGVAAAAIEMITATGTTIAPARITRIEIGTQSAAIEIGTAIEMTPGTRVTRGQTARTEIDSSCATITKLVLLLSAGFKDQGFHDYDSTDSSSR